MGEPHAKALAKAEAEGIALPQTVEALRAQASAFLLKATAHDKDGAGGEEPHPFASWFGGADPADKGPPVPEFYLPSRYLPAFWPLFFLGTVATLHALAALLQVWLVDARCWVRFRRVGGVHQATHVRVSLCGRLIFRAYGVVGRQTAPLDRSTPLFDTHPNPTQTKPKPR